MTLSVADYRGGPLLVLGGPGTGKTHALEQRYLSLAAEPDLAPHRILLLCNNRAWAADARNRLVWQLPQQATLEVPFYTWHGLAYHLVSRFYPTLGYAEPPVLLTGPEQWGAVRELAAKQNPAEWGDWAGRLNERAFIDELADFCLRVQQRLDGPDELALLVKARADWAPVVDFYGRYRDFLKLESRLDYAGLLAEAVRLLEQDEQVRETLSRRFPHILVDDGQEMGKSHRQLLISLGVSNLTVAADPDSGIESFRGAEPDWVFGFEKWFGPSTTIELFESKRIGLPLSSAATQLIRHNDAAATHRFREPAAHATEFQCRIYGSAAEEVEAIARELKLTHLQHGVAWSEMAVLISQPRFLLGPLERALDELEVPHGPMIGDRPLAAEPAVKGFLDLVKFALGRGEAGGPASNGAAELLPELLTSPLGGLDYSARRRLERLAWHSGKSLQEVVEESSECEELRALIDIVVKHRSKADECFWQVYRRSAYYRELEEGHPASRAVGENNQALDSLVAFAHSLSRFVERRHGSASIDDYLKEAARADFGGDPWVPPLVDDEPGVALVSFHGAKGREWHTVFVAGCLDAWIPKGRRAQGLFDPFLLEAPEVAHREIEAIADDRRTFYVAATRARSRTLFTVSPAGSGRARPSRFLFELSGRAPEEPPADAFQALTRRELTAVLRREFAEPGSSPARRIAAVIALSEIPEVDPTRWYGRWEWTSGATPLVDGDLKTSFSRLGVFENCGLQYLLQSVLGLDPSSTYSMKFGTWIHALFQAVHESKIKAPPQLLAEYEKLFDATIFPSSTIARQFKRDGEKMLQVFWENERDHHTVKAEHSFAIPFAGAVLRGRIDRVDRIERPATRDRPGTRGALKLTDYKTAKWAPSYSKAEKSLQLAIYHYAALHDPELQELGEPAIARLVYPGATSRAGKYQVLNQSPEQAAQVLETLPEMIASVRSEDFRPSPHADCFFCKMKPLCPLWPDGSEVQT
ncbi:MAG: ATP-dependent helicase [Actinomycetota bacterium]